MKEPALLGAVAMLLIAGCAVKNAKPPAVERHYDVQPQVIYRIDDHRFISLENYTDCHHGTTYYNDTHQGIRTELGWASKENYRGRLINADPTGQNIVIPNSTPPKFACPDKGCRVSFAYSTDGGRTFKGEWYMSNTQTPYLDSADYIMAATADRIYIAKRWGSRDYSVTQYPLIPGIDLRKEYPPGVRGASFKASDRPDYLKGLRTPSGQEYLSCDDSIRPKNLPAKK
ncbi:T6SS immunity protein Tli3 family protein [Cupriavidus sp. 30B13]|uniref:T6SS immunity protein Tli3 family protein n=1 Tax=Cupriavidus sp. 30B13 TaxID=3384241 RepID=UPI003B908F9F